SIRGDLRQELRHEVGVVEGDRLRCLEVAFGRRQPQRVEVQHDAARQRSTKIGSAEPLHGQRMKAVEASIAKDGPSAEGARQVVG
ncbi:MAG: hypothetical protein ACK559_02925, partial [bacterium]